MFTPIRFKASIQLAPDELSSNFEENILSKIRSNLEGICSRYGYIRPGSLHILKRSMGKFIKQHFNGHITFDLICTGEACNPSQGLIVQATVKNKNVLGLLAESSILDIIIPKKAAGLGSEVNLDEINIGDTIYVMVMGKRYQLNDTKISIIGKAVKDPDLQNNNQGAEIEYTEQTEIIEGSEEAIDEEDIDDKDDEDKDETELVNIDVGGGLYDDYSIDEGNDDDDDGDGDGDDNSDGDESTGGDIDGEIYYD